MYIYKYTHKVHTEKKYNPRNVHLFNFMTYSDIYQIRV